MLRRSPSATNELLVGTKGARRAQTQPNDVSIFCMLRICFCPTYVRLRL